MLDQRDLTRFLLTAWMTTSCPDSTIVSLSDINDPLQIASVQCLELVVIGVQMIEGGLAWLRRQTDALRAIRQDLPMAAIIDGGDGRSVLTHLGEAGIASYVPTTSSPRAAAAALQLIAAGEQYRPRLSDEQSQGQEEFAIDHAKVEAIKVVNRLTPRERSVLDLLRSGVPNKVIAYRLGLSQSTVKAHVHSVILKLEVRNRTEAALKGRLLTSASGMAESLSPLAELESSSFCGLRSTDTFMPVGRAPEPVIASGHMSSGAQDGDPRGRFIPPAAKSNRIGTNVVKDLLTLQPLRSVR